ncbi:MAG: type II toxin-antitoxin system RelE/ParE family toxin [Planctomycetota bacterium]|nr:type II toxin-antitoxin system RelE/ParE family toxin [Planctomycetota bacterium]
MVYEVVLSPAAEQDLESIYTYISQDQPANAAQVCEKILDSLEKLRDYPLCGQVVPEFDDDDLREISMPPYRLVYRLNHQRNRAEVVRIWDARREKLLLDDAPGGTHQNS